MFDKLTDTKLGIIGTTSAIIGSAFLAPQKAVIPTIGCIMALTGSILFAKSRWVTSQANEWLLVIRDGQMVKSGVGLKTFIGFTDTVVKFPSKIQHVTYTANNVTKQMQGVQITGFAFWSVYRENDGPFRCYKYMMGNDANANVQALCESVLRSLIANSSLQDVLRSRNHLRDSIKQELKDQFKGWGVWLQTVEITEVKISSTRLFTDLQAQFRQEVRLKAEQIELAGNEKISQVKQTTTMKINELKDTVKTKKQIISNTENIKRKQLESNFEAKKNEIQIKKMQREKKLELERYKNDFVISQQKQKNKQQIEQIEQQFQNKQVAKDFELEKMHTPLTLEKYQIDSMARVFANQGFRNVSINQFSGSDKQTISAILPILGYGAAQLKTGSS